MLLTTSGFKNKDSIKQLIELHASVMSWAFSPDLTCQVTHVLVPASSDEAMEARTDKLQAILADRSLWPQHVVNIKWLEECVNEGRVVPVGPFLVTLIPPCSDQQPQAEVGSSRGISEDWGSMIRDLIKTGKIGVDPEVALTEQDRQGLKQAGAEVAELTQGTFGIDLIICESDRAAYWIKEWGFLGHVLSLSAVRRLNGNASPPRVSVISTDCLRSMQQNMSVTQEPLPYHPQPDVACTDAASGRREVLRSMKSSESNVLVRPPASLTLLSQLRWTVGSSPQSTEAAEASQSEVFESDARVLYSCGITVVVPLDEGGFLGLHPVEIKSPFSAPYLTCGDITSAINVFYEQKIEDEEVVRLMRLHPGIRKLLQSKYLNRQMVQRLDLLGSRISFAGMERVRGGGAVGGEIYEALLVK